MLRLRAILIACILLATLDASAASGRPTFTLHATGDSLTSDSDPSVAIANLTGDDETVRFQVEAPDDVEGSVVFDTRFNVSRPQQVVPWIDGVIPPERAEDQLAARTGPAFNVTQEGHAIRFLLRVPAGTHSVEFMRDVRPPSWSIEPLVHVTHNSATVVTRTDEAALAVLALESPRAGLVTFSTPAPGGQQTFPLSGLDPETSYNFRITFEDFSGNVVTTDPQEFRTAVAPILPRPTIELVAPTNGSTNEFPVTLVHARIQDSASPIRSVSLYVDKAYVPEATRFLAADTFRYEPEAPLGPGRHTVLIEAANEAGGTERLIAKFVVDARSTPLPGAVVIAAFVGSALLLSLARNRRAGWEEPNQRS